MGRTRTFCEIDECGAPAVGRRMCGKHYQRWRKWGDPRFVDSRWKQAEVERFWSYVDKSGDCWRWTAGLSHGYGNFYVGSPGGRGPQVQAHRYAYELCVGPISEGMTLDHGCHTAVADECRDGAACPHRACVRPDHMVQMPLSDNIRRGGHGVRTSCKRGHEFTPGNTGIYDGRQKGRFCRTCKRADQARLRARRREARTSAPR